MTDMTLTTLTLNLAQLSRSLDDAQRALSQAEHDAAVARHEADLAEAKAYVAAEGTVDERKRLALIQTAQVKLDADVAEADVKAARSDIRRLLTKVDVGRTLISSARAEMTNFGGQT